jgi:hypothetical protein
VFQYEWVIDVIETGEREFECIRPSQYMWTLKMDAPRIRLQERNRTFDAGYTRAFCAVARSFLVSVEDEQPRKTALQVKKTKIQTRLSTTTLNTLRGPRNPDRFLSCGVLRLQNKKSSRNDPKMHLFLFFWGATL